MTEQISIPVEFSDQDICSLSSRRFREKAEIRGHVLHAVVKDFVIVIWEWEFSPTGRPNTKKN